MAAAMDEEEAKENHGTRTYAVTQSSYDLVLDSAWLKCGRVENVKARVRCRFANNEVRGFERPLSKKGRDVTVLAPAGPALPFRGFMKGDKGKSSALPGSGTYQLTNASFAEFAGTLLGFDDYVSR
ncbi:MAG: hypothetical protein Q9169_003494 [Polycauliona sp. 2 TL-2023]